MRKLVGFVVVGVLSLLVLWAIHGASGGMQHGPMSGAPMPNSQGTAKVAAAGATVAMAGHDHSTHGAAGHTDSSPEHAGASSGGKSDGSAAGSAGHADTGEEHAHGRVDVSEVADRPDLEVVMRRDSVSGWNLQITTTNFKFAPYNVNGKHLMGEGHAHIYINGKKLARLYGPWFHVPALSAGTHHIEVTLNANNHAEYMFGEQRVSRKLTITER